MEKKISTKKNNPKNQSPTLLQAIEHVAELAKDSKMSADFICLAKPELSFLATSYGITERQAVLFCICMERGPRRVDYDDIASYLDISKIKALGYASDIDAMVHRRLLRFRDVKDEDDFDIPTVVIRCLKHNEVYELPQRTGLDCAGMFELLNLWFEDLSDDAVSAQELREELKSLYDDNPQVGFVRHLKEYQLNEEDLLLVTLFCHLLINCDDDDIRFGQIENAYDNNGSFNNAKAELRSGEHHLMRQNIIEHRCEDGIANNNRFKLTEEAKRNLLAELKVNTVEEKIADMVEIGKLTEKKLFFSEHIEHQVSELASFLQPENFKKVQERMRAKGFRNGFACLFYGGPGTGKTETVYQLARQTGRNIMVVDVPQIKSKWVGESEKNIKALFDRYRDMVKNAKLTPILLFNEADAIIGKRKNGAENAVDKMENSIQNIILQEMETLDGIMVATTNLEQNLDKAFERRFLYKIKFEKPDADVRRKIWMQMIPELSEADATILSASFDFSGGQIENIARKNTINVILHGESTNLLPTLQDYCQAEKLEAQSVRKIGF